jgi:phosphinothricin acetyltransferase
MRARLATPADAAAIAEIYNEAIEARGSTFETVLRTEQDVRGWFDGAHPIVVVEDEGQASDAVVVAFGSTSSYRARDCYRGIFEFSVYVAGSHRRKGAGKIAMSELLARARASGAWTVVSRVFVDNEGCRALLGSLGFREVGTYLRHAKLDGVWRDVVVVEKFLAPLGGVAASPQRLARDEILRALRSADASADAQPIDDMRAILEEQQTHDADLLEAAVDAFVAGAKAHDPERRGRFVRLFAAYAALSAESARELYGALFARLRTWSIAADLPTFYEAVFVIKQTSGIGRGALELSPYVPDLVEWLAQAIDLPKGFGGRISPANVSSLLMSLALAATISEEQKSAIVELAKGAQGRHSVPPPASIRPAPYTPYVPVAVAQVEGLSLQIRSLATSLRHGALDAATAILLSLLEAEIDEERLVEAIRAQAWDDAMVLRLLDVLDVLDAALAPASARTTARVLLTALQKRGSRAAGQARLRRMLDAWKRKAGAGGATRTKRKPPPRSTG